MNLLFTIDDTSIAIVALIFFVIIILISFIIYTVTKNEKIEPISEDERFDNEKSEFFENIKPETKEQQEAKEELERVFKQMSEDLEKETTSKEVIEDFEREQEENAIISYQELIKQAEEKRKHPNMVKEETVYHKDAKSEEPKRFRNSDIISPIFGVQTPSEYQKQAKENQEKSYEEINLNYHENSNTDFLNSLKEFRKNL